MENKWYYRWAPSLGDGFAGTPEQVWGVEKYDPEKHINENVVFCGLYGLPDFYALWRHNGRKAIFWCGSDIRHFVQGYFLDDIGRIRIDPLPLVKWISKYCESWVENLVERKKLEEFKIYPKVGASFFGDVNKFPLSYQWSKKPKLYTSVSGNDFQIYGWDKIDELACKYPAYEFHLYGNSVPWKTKRKNIIVHGRVSQEQMNKEIKTMQGALRLVEFEGASELIVKAMLMGQYAFSSIPYIGVSSIDEMGILETQNENNRELTRKFWVENLNLFPWNLKK